MKIIRGAKKVAEFHESFVNPKRIQDTTWFRVAATVYVEDVVAFVFDDEAMFFSDVGYYLPWGFSYGNDIWTLGEESTRQLAQAIEGDGGYLTGTYVNQPPASVRSQYAGDDWASATLPIVSNFTSYEQFSRSVWTHKRRYNVERDLKPYRSLEVRRWTKMVWSRFAFVCEKSVLAAARGSVPASSTFSDSMYRASQWNLLQHMNDLGLVFGYDVFDGDKLVATNVCVYDSIDNAIILIASHADERYPSLGKMLYELLVQEAIDRQVTKVSGGLGKNGLKSLFGFQYEDLWDSEIGKGDRDEVSESG